MQLYALAAALGALLAYFFDPQSGKRRRNVTRDWLAGRARGGARRTARAGRTVAAEAYGVKQKATHMREEPKEFDDVTLARKVETELFRPADAPKGSVTITVVDGVVQLRGEVKRPEQLKDLERQAREIPEVRGVENLLHLPKTPAPTRTDTPATARKRAARSGGGSQRQTA
jgi:hypothetical protein